MSEPLRVLLIGDTDSQLHYCHALSQIPGADAVQTTINVVPRDGTPESLLEQLRSHGPVWQFPLDRLLRQPSLREFQAIGVFLTGSKISAFRTAYHKICSQDQARPAILFCGFNGVVLENFEEGISWRLGYDLICLNGPRDLCRLKRLVRFTPFASQQTAITGLSRRSQLKLKSEDSAEQRQKRLIFAEQVVMPRRPADRAHMVCILADLARRSPQWEIIIKPRVRPEERTFHSGLEHITQTIDKAVGMQPANLKVSYEPIADLLRTSRLMGTISSTAVFDALDLGCRPFVMADFGWVSGNGTPFFKDSGLLRRLDDCKSLEQLDAELSPPDARWLDWVGYGENYTPANLYAQIRSLLTDYKSCSPLNLPGYEIAQIITDAPSKLGLSSNQLRAEAELAIRREQWQEAEELLLDALQQKPDNRNIKRRLRAVRCRNPLIRNVRLVLSPKFKLKA